MFNVNMFKNAKQNKNVDFNRWVFIDIVVGFALQITWEEQFH